jgi:hypothetical protein
MATKRPRLFVAASYDPRAGVGFVVVELRGNPSRFWEHEVQQPAPPAVLVEFGLAVARNEQLRDFDILLTSRVRKPTDEVRHEFGQLRLRLVARRKNVPARKRAHLKLRERVPRPPRSDDEYTLADYGVDLEIASFNAECEAGPEDPCESPRLKTC